MRVRPANISSFVRRLEKFLFRSTSNSATIKRMKTQTPATILAAKVSARIREFCVARGISADALVRAAKLSPTETQLLEAESEDMTRDMLERIAAVFGVHLAVLCMEP